MTTNTNSPLHRNIHFQRTLNSPSDTLAADWLPTNDLYQYLGEDSTVAYWHATEYLAVPARIGGYEVPHEYFAAYDDSTWGIDINEMQWASGGPYGAEVTITQPSVADVPGSVPGRAGGVPLYLGRGRAPLCQRPR